MDVQINIPALIKHETNLSKWNEVDPPSFSEQAERPIEGECDVKWFRRGKTYGLAAWMTKDRCIRVEFYSHEGEKREALPKIQRGVKYLDRNHYIPGDNNRKLYYARKLRLAN